MGAPRNRGGGEGAPGKKTGARGGNGLSEDKNDDRGIGLPEKTGLHKTSPLIHEQERIRGKMTGWSMGAGGGRI